MGEWCWLQLHGWWHRHDPCPQRCQGRAGCAAWAWPEHSWSLCQRCRTRDSHWGDQETAAPKSPCATARGIWREGLFVNRTTPGSALAGLFTGKHQQSSCLGYSPEKAPGQGLRACPCHKPPNNPSGQPGLCALPTPLEPGSRQAGTFLVIEFHRPPKCSVHFFLMTHKSHIVNQWLSCPDPENFTQIN